jgi:plasmid stabilization system protein ParE
LAEDKLDDIYSYYSVKAGKRTAKRLINGIVNTTIGVENQPEIGQLEVNLDHRKEEFRYLIFKNYKIVYWINYESERIEIANIFDTRQNPEKLKKTK